MKGKRLFALVIIVLALAAVLTGPLAGCAGGVGFPAASPTPSLGKATTCKSVDPQTKEPVEPTNTFTTDASEIFCSVKLSNAPSGTEISSEWIYVKGETGEVVNYLIDTWNTVTGGSGYLSFSITRPDAGWPAGDYKVVLYLDGNEASSVSFKVQ